MENFLKKGQKVLFNGESKPFTVMAISEQYAVVVRQLHRREDAELLHHEVLMGAYCSFTDAYNSMKKYPVYSLLDFESLERSSSNLVFNYLDYFKEKDCKKAIKMLESGEMELSRRRVTDLEINIIY